MNYTKAQMLLHLKENLQDINILPVYILKSNIFYCDKQAEIDKIYREFGDKELIVRSSSKQEDTESKSNAGRFTSVLHVKASDMTNISNAIENVYASYSTSEDEEILIQPMLTKISKSGVVFTVDMETFADYYVVNYSENGDTEAVTSGSTNELKTFIAYKGKKDIVDDRDMKQLIDTCTQIENYLENHFLDIEFAIDENHVVYILQVRDIAKGSKEVYKKIDLSSPLKRISKKVEKLSKPHPFLLGDTTCFGVMPDWNPAEILGVRPKKLAISLYKELITDNVWAHQRDNYGYRDLTMHPLMVSFCGIPYIDTRITFNSFIPKNLNERIAEKLVSYYLKRLATYPTYHDKIEFQIVFSCYYIGISDKLSILKEYNFNENEIKRIEFSLLQITNHIIHPQYGLYKEDINKIKELEQNHKRILESDISLVDKIYWLIEECKAYGTLPFAGVARAAFIAIQFLQSFVNQKIITTSDYDEYMNSLNTISKQFREDIERLKNCSITKEFFLAKYGHIRPGTYDILSKRYDEDYAGYFGQINATPMKKQEPREIFTEAIMDKIQTELEENGLKVSACELLAFIKEAIEGREYLKFVFTKSVSEILRLIEELGVRVGISKDDMAYLDVGMIKQLYVDLYYGDISGIFSQNIQKNKEQYEYARQIKLPSIIVEPKDVYSYFLLNEEANFITQKTIRAEAVRQENIDNDVQGKIVFIQSADPGYDFLFSRNIGGLITQFGGANSHMAIRCAELGIPAVIGVGEKNYNIWKSNIYLEVDCAKRQVLGLNNITGEIS